MVHESIDETYEGGYPLRENQVENYLASITNIILQQMYSFNPYLIPTSDKYLNCDEVFRYWSLRSQRDDARAEILRQDFLCRMFIDIADVGKLPSNRELNEYIRLQKKNNNLVRQKFSVFPPIASEM